MNDLKVGLKVAQMKTLFTTEDGEWEFRSFQWHEMNLDSNDKAAAVWHIACTRPLSLEEKRNEEANYYSWMKLNPGDMSFRMPAKCWECSAPIPSGS